MFWIGLHGNVHRKIVSGVVGDRAIRCETKPVHREDAQVLQLVHGLKVGLLTEALARIKLDLITQKSGVGCASLFNSDDRTVRLPLLIGE